MFAVYCEGHGQRVLLSSDHIEAILNSPDGLAVQWRCDQGHRGCWRPGRPEPAIRPRLAA